MTAQNKILKVVVGLGGEAYLVGGSVRDALLSLPVKDFDYLVTGVALEPLTEGLSADGFKVDLVGKSFGVVKATYEGVTYDIALPRTERSTGTGHKDFEVNVDPAISVEEDLSRRDFTVNAIALRLRDNEYVDPFGGIADLARQTLRAVGSARARFEEDPLRMMRAVRFMGKLGFSLDDSTLDALADQSYLIGTVAPERIQEELIRLLSYDNFERVRMGLHTFYKTGLFQEALKPNKLSTRASINLALMSEVWFLKGDLLARLGAFFDMFPDPMGVMERLKFSNSLKANVDRVIDVADALFTYESEEREFRRAINKADSEEVFNSAVTLMQAEFRMRVPGATTKDAERAAKRTRERFQPLTWLLRYDAAKVPVDGQTLVERFGVRGREIGCLKQYAAMLIVEGEVVPEVPAVLAALEEAIQKKGLKSIQKSLDLRGIA